LTLRIPKKISFIILAFVLCITGCTDVTVTSQSADEELSPVAMALTQNSRQEPIDTPTPAQIAEVTPIDCEPTLVPTLASVPTDAAITTTPVVRETDPAPNIKVCEEGDKVFFGDNYIELPKGSYINQLIVPDTIVLHTDGQSGDYPEKWNTMTTYWGLGSEKSVHFAVSQDGILQMLPMYETTTLYGIGTTPFFTDENNIIDYNERSIQIEMAGRYYDDIVTGDASPKKIEVVEMTTHKTIDLVITLMEFYNIPIENIMGHYQINPGNTDPGRLYFEQYFLPLLIETWNELN
jgi:hypothetical protein